MLRFVRKHFRAHRTPAGRRQLRLFACACCRRVWPLLGDLRSRHAVEVSERYADGLATLRDLSLAEGAADAAARGAAREGRSAPAAALAVLLSQRDANLDPWLIAGAAATALAGSRADAGKAEMAAQAEALRDIFGNPFHAVPLVPGWRTPDVLTLASAVYDRGAFDRMPILSDALEEAGCASTALLDHCRGPGPHVRGCWLLDLLLDKQRAEAP
jgi:hypothetical protein